MTTRTRRRHQQRNAVADSAPVTNGNGEARVRPSVAAAGQTRHRRRANLGLSVLFMLIVAVGAGSGFFGSLHLPKQYAARAELHYSLSQAPASDLLREDRTLTTQLILLRSRVVLGPVASDSGMTPEDLADNVSAKVVDSSEIIQVEVRDRTRERAEALLAGVVAQYLNLANSDWKDPVRSYLEFQLNEVRKQLQAPGVPVENATALAQQEAVLRGLLDFPPPMPPDSPEFASAPPASELVAPYAVPAPVSPTPMFAAAAGGTTGFVIAAFVVLLVVRRRLRS